MASFEEARPLLARLAIQESVRRGDAFEALAHFRELNAILAYECLTNLAQVEVVGRWKILAFHHVKDGIGKTAAAITLPVWRS